MTASSCEAMFQREVLLVIGNADQGCAFASSEQPAGWLPTECSAIQPRCDIAARPSRVRRDRRRAARRRTVASNTEANRPETIAHLPLSRSMSPGKHFATVRRIDPGNWLAAHRALRNEGIKIVRGLCSASIQIAVCASHCWVLSGASIPQRRTRVP